MKTFKGPFLVFNLGIREPPSEISRSTTDGTVAYIIDEEQIRFEAVIHSQSDNTDSNKVTFIQTD